MDNTSGETSKRGSETQTRLHVDTESGHAQSVSEARLGLEAALWSEYFASSDKRDVIDRLVEYYVPQVKYMASRVKNYVPGLVDFDELVAAGMMGVFTSIEKFDPSREFKFWTFCYQRVEGAMIDWMRTGDSMTRQMRMHVKAVDSYCDKKEVETGLRPSPEEACTALGISRSVLAFAVCKNPKVMNYEDNDILRSDLGNFADVVTRDERLVDHRVVDNRLEFEDTLEDMCKLLPESYRRIFRMYYGDGFRMLEIGEVVGRSESWVCQILKACREWLLPYKKRWTA